MVTWALLYYKEVGGFDIKSMALASVTVPISMALMILGVCTLTMAPTTALGVDLAGRQISGTASDLLDAQAYLYNSLQALVIGWMLDGTGGSWMLVF